MAIGRLLIKVIAVVGQVLGKSVKDAYIQTIKAAESNASKLGSSNSPAVAQVSSTLSMDEAGKILNLPLPGSTLDQAKEKFEKYFKSNARKDDWNGSFYLQSKFVRAYERFEAESRVNPKRVPPSS
ncbi:mitochondrial import inner membrane translocase subunit TIM16 [Mitosporidium daphniae]